MVFVITVQIYYTHSRTHSRLHARACVFYSLQLEEVKQTYTLHCCASPNSLSLFSSMRLRNLTLIAKHSLIYTNLVISELVILKIISVCQLNQFSVCSSDYTS